MQSARLTQEYNPYTDLEIKTDRSLIVLNGFPQKPKNEKKKTQAKKEIQRKHYVMFILFMLSLMIDDMWIENGVWHHFLGEGGGGRI